ncbi:alpha-L-rhamnosidase [Marinomonas transparens]|uniref:alpha-L-rhamnosidase n=1 Tax=Marinomonas transparens TaxID=2795388 RepID=A0A934JMX4_9GAMM|nr:alpha-L-rhamnosidase [Marinomonas transparens]MBJ7538756.1 family 78 glycoside hydrolase catalytic domain [Marinomonas transparens]
MSSDILRTVKSSAVTWVADMVAPSCDEGVGKRACFVCSTFVVSSLEHTAQLTISALGLYQVFINGRQVGDDYLTPGLTCYDDRLSFQTYHVNEYLQLGSNKIEIWLADGWYRSQIMWEECKILNCWGDSIAAIAQLELAGEVICKTDASWQSGYLPVTQSGIYLGEDYDAREERLIASHGVNILEFDKTLLVPHETAAVKALASVSPVKTWYENGDMVVDFGQNCSAVVRIQVDGNAGASLYIDFAEILDEEGCFDRRNYRDARVAVQYTLKGEGIESYEPRFTFMGFRYARIKLSGEVKLHSIQQIPLTSVPIITGGFECDVPAVNRLVQNTIWSQRSNFIEIPTDCPQRDERLGWTGDAQVFAGTACWLADCESFLIKYLRDVIHDQRPNGAIPHFSPDPTRLFPEMFDGDWAGSTGWGDAITIIPWQIYLQYGNVDILRECFPAMQKWLDHLWSLSDGPIIKPNLQWGGHGFTFGDWLQPVGDNRKPRPTIADDCAATLYHYISTDLAVKIAHLLGKEQEASALEKRALCIKEAFVDEYFSKTGRLAHNDQTSYSLAFLYDLVPEQYFDAAKHYFREVIVDAQYLIGTGFIGTPALLPALTKLGMNDLAENVFLNRKVPGWLYQIERGATTIWERWDAIAEDGTIYDPNMNSYNHYAYGAVCQWLFESVAGVSPVAHAPGYKEVLLSPTFLPALGRVSMWHDCGLGRIEASWRILEDKVAYSLSLPNGCVGILSSRLLESVVTMNGQAMNGSLAGVTVPSGKSEIVFSLT